MPPYFFHYVDGYAHRDLEGTELSDIYMAQAEAVKLSGEILRDMGAKFWNGTNWKLTVENDTGEMLFTLNFSAEEGTALSVVHPSRKAV